MILRMIDTPASRTLPTIGSLQCIISGSSRVTLNFRIANTFTSSLTRLNGQEQKAVKTTAFDLQLDPVSPGMQFHRIDRSKDPNFWSLRVNRDIRMIVHKTASSLLLCYVDHHDDAYRWAERRKIERHPKTGAAQLVELREAVQESTHPVPLAEIAQSVSEPPLFAHLSDDELLGCGVPEDWLGEVCQADEDGLLALVDHLPQEAMEALLRVATGEAVEPVARLAPSADPFSHPDAQRRFRVLSNVEELQRALDYPWERWTVFLHPEQRRFVERDYNGPARISGSAGTGKTIVALHRAVVLARRHPGAKVLLTTFSRTLAKALEVKLGRLAGNEPAVHERITVQSISDVGIGLYTAALNPPNVVEAETLRHILTDVASKQSSDRFGTNFLLSEWQTVVDPWQLHSWEEYRDVARLGRKTRIGGKQREALWSIFERTRQELQRRGEVTSADVFDAATTSLRDRRDLPYDYVVVDEAQDIGVTELRFLAALGSRHPDGLFFAGDLGQRIFQQPFSWKALGIDIRGRSHTLKINYRTSHQIRSRADRLLPSAIADVDGVEESRRGTVSVFNGPPPDVRVCDDEEDEAATVAEWIRQRIGEGILPDEIGVFVRAEPQLARACAAIERAGLKSRELAENAGTDPDSVSAGTMHLAKGLEFKAVVVMACDDEVIPLQERIESVTDSSDLDEVYNTERHLLYVACTRARDHLLITGVDPASEFLDDLAGNEGPRGG